MPVAALWNRACQDPCLLSRTGICDPDCCNFPVAFPGSVTCFSPEISDALNIAPCYALLTAPTSTQTVRNFENGACSRYSPYFTCA